MNRWQNRVAVVTGASAGIGAAILKTLVNAGLITVGLARREERFNEIRNSLPGKLHSRLHSIKCDVTDESDVHQAFAWIEENLGGTDILVNNAGVLHTNSLTDPNTTRKIRETIDVNVMGVFFATREAYNSMHRRNFDGHIVMINSTAGHKVESFGRDFPPLNMYPASKFAITALTETYRQEFLRDRSKVRVTSVSPGNVDTTIIPDDVRAAGGPDMPMLKPQDIADAIVYALGAPAHVQIHEIIIKPVGEE